MRYLFVLCLVLCLILAGCATEPAQTTAITTQKVDSVPAVIYFDGLCYGPFSGLENPACGPYPTLTEIKSDLAKLVKATKKIRIYSLLGINAEIPKIARGAGLYCLGGCWLGKEDPCNEAEVVALIKSAKQGDLKQLVVGNEVLLRGDVTEDKLISIIRRVKEETGLPVGYAEIESVWLRHPKVAAECDFILVHIYAFWDGISIKEAVPYTLAKYDEIKATFPSKEIIIGELGWPKGGETQDKAVPTVANQNKFARAFIKEAKVRSIPYYYFEAFDEEWKGSQEGSLGATWGWQGLKREANWNQSVIDKFPFIVYDDFSTASHFIPSGWMGDTENITYDNACTKNPHSGKTCIKIVWKCTGMNWSGIYWQYPENNWGDLPGYKFKGVKKLTFWVRGDKGGEHSEFKIGGIASDKKFVDSLSLQALDVGMTKEWKKYQFDLPQQNLDCVISGFCWVASWSGNPNGATIYLDDIQFE